MEPTNKKSAPLKLTLDGPPAPRHTYAVHWPCGVCLRAETGRPYRTVHRFATAAARDRWIDGGDPIRTNRGYREAVSAKDVRREIWRAFAVGPDRPWRGTEDGHDVLDG